jgi:hypothetical protein
MFLTLGDRTIAARASFLAFGCSSDFSCPSRFQAGTLVHRDKEKPLVTIHLWMAESEPQPKFLKSMITAPVSTNAMKWISGLILLSLLMGFEISRAQTPNERYLQVLSTINQADSLSEEGQTDSAKAKYEEARTALLDFRKRHPSSNTKLVAFRLKYVNEKLAALAKPAPGRLGRRESGGFEPAELKLLDAGSAPRKVLRIAPTPGDKQTMDLTLTTELDLGGGQAIKMPPITMAMEVTVKSVSEEGGIAFEAVIGEAGVAEEPGVMPEVAAAMKASLTGIDGLSIAGTLSNRGLTESSQIKMPAGASLQVRQQVEQMQDALANFATPFPEEAIGIGARWEVRQPIQSQGMNINQAVTYELASLEGDLVSLECAIVQQAANQRFENPSLPGMQVDLTKMTGQGTGELTLDLTKIGPLLAIIHSDSEMAMSINLGSQKQPLAVKTKMNLRMQTR